MKLRHTRRRMLSMVAATAIAGLAEQPRAQRGIAPIAQPSKPGAAAFAARAADMRRLANERGDQPYGAVVVKDGRIVGEGVSAVITDRDPTAHAEMQAIRDAAQRLGTNDLSGCDLYGTSRACPMCASAAYWARVSRMYHGDGPTDDGSPQLC